MIGIGLPYLLDGLGPLGQGLHGRVEEPFDITDLLRDGLTECVHEGIKQSLDVVVNDGLHWRGID